MFDLSGRTAIVTGAGRGLGKAIALALAEAGADLVAVARTTSEIEATAAAARQRGRRALVVPTDVTQVAQVNAMVEQAMAEYGKVDVLVNNVGLYWPKPALEVTDEEWDYVLRTVLHSQFYCVRAVGRHMVEQRYGKIINIGSHWGMIGVANNVPYSVAKGAVLQMTKALAVEWARYGVRVNAICPGHIRTQLTEKELADPKIYALIMRHLPLKYVSEPKDIAPLAVYLASAASDFMTGSSLVIDGGQNAE